MFPKMIKILTWHVSELFISESVLFIANGIVSNKLHCVVCWVVLSQESIQLLWCLTIQRPNVRDKPCRILCKGAKLFPHRVSYFYSGNENALVVSFYVVCCICQFVTTSKPHTIAENLILWTAGQIILAKSRLVKNSHKSPTI